MPNSDMPVICGSKEFQATGPSANC